MKLYENILNNVCYTELVYERINKKLNRTLSKDEIEKLIFEILKETKDQQYQKTGKNIYVTNTLRNIRITINANNYRVITVDDLDKYKKKRDCCFLS
jgi:FKBP-type peptidyl-prolyl cis-trans isomerase (trigger factor)